MNLRIPAAAVSFAALLACSGAEEQKQASAPPVTVAEVVAIELEDRIEAAGELVSPSRPTIAADARERPA